MKYALIVAAGLLVAAQPAKDDAKKDADKVQGTWIIQSVEQGGQTLADHKGDKMVVTGDKFTVTGNAGDMKGTVKIDAAKKLKEIDMDFTEGPFSGKTLGIYALEGDVLKLCLGVPPGSDRPKEFGSKEGSTSLFVTMKRQAK